MTLDSRNASGRGRRGREAPGSGGVLLRADFHDFPLSDSVYRSIRSAIEAGQFEPGERLLEVDLAKLLGVSRTPVRDALRRLVSEGLLTIIPARGVIVTELDEVEVVELYSVLEVLEGTAAEFAANRASEDNIAQLGRILDEEQESLGDLDKLVTLNNDFHHAVYAAAHNRYLVRSVRWLSDSLNLLRGSTLVDQARQRTSHDEHLQIASAIKRRDPEVAGQVARRHIREAKRIRMQMLFGA
jgi:DNA-binding GntR family transcriptional regulator